MNIKEFLEEKICGYKNCTKVIEGRSDKQYCCDNHRTYAKIYRNRRKKLIEKYKLKEMKYLDGYVTFKKIFEDEIKKGYKNEK